MGHQFLRGIALAALFSVATLAAASDHAPPPLRIDPLTERFMRTSSFVDIRLSPDGKHLATVAAIDVDTGNGIRRQGYVMMVDTATLGASIIVAPNTPAAGYKRWPVAVRWLGNEELGINLSDGTSESRHLDGTIEARLGGQIVSVLRDAQGKMSDWVLARSLNKAYWVERVNLHTGERLPYAIDVPGTTVAFTMDPRGDIMTVQNRDTEFWNDVTRVSTWYRASVSSAWQKIDERSAVHDDFLPVLASDRPGHLLVRSRNGGDRKAIWDYDVDKHEFVAKVAADDVDDVVNAQVRLDGASVIGFETAGLKRRAIWLDPRLAKLQAWVDEKLPDHDNYLSGEESGPLLVRSFSDIDPGHCYVLDPAAMTLKPVLSMSPTIDPGRMQSMRTLHYPSVDGLSIPAYLTLPGKSSTPAPLIVLIHGGPLARDYWQWDEDVQLFAAHGYAVFQPQFRGSTGFGAAFERAGYRQFGLAMQDDVTAGVRWLIDQKLADPARICIVGTSYGGYAALWGLEKTPELYKCGVSTSGPSDIEDLVTSESAGSRSGEVREIWRETIGDPKQMRDTWASVSPRRHADRIHAPLLIVHGEGDEIVPLSHGKKMVDILEDLHKDVQMLEFSDEFHGVQIRQDRRIWFGAMLELFARTIGEGDAPVPPSAREIAVARKLATDNKQELWLPRGAAVAASAAH